MLTRLQQIFVKPKHPWHQYALLGLSILSVIVISLYCNSLIKTQYEAKLRQQLQQSIDEKFADYERWMVQLKASAKIFAASERLKQISREFESPSKDARNKFVINHLTGWYSMLRKNSQFVDFLLLDKHQTLIANSDPNYQSGKRHLALPSEFFQEIWQGESVISLPIKSEVPLQDQSGRRKSGLTSFFVGVPVIDDNQNLVIAALLLRLDPSEFNALFKNKRADKHYESYAFNRNFQLISESEYDNDLRKKGLLKETSSITNIVVKLPGATLPLSANTTNSAEPISFRLNPYNNYRNKRVIGAWSWHPSQRMGIAFEIDAYSALQNFSTMQFILLATAIFLLAMIAVIYYQAKQIAKNQRIQAYLPSLLEIGSEAMLSTDNQGTILYANHRVTELLGYSLDEILDKNIDMLLPEALRELHAVHRQEFMKAPRRRLMGSGMELHAQHKNGDVVLIEVGLNPFQYKNLWGVTVAMRDISVQQQLQFELSRYRGRLDKLVEKRTAELEANRKELESYSYTIAHDLRTPLRAITGYSQLLLNEDEFETQAEKQDALNRIVGASKRMADMIDDILELSRITRKEVQYASVNLSLLVEKSIESIQKKNPQQKIEFKIEKNLIVQGDQRLLSLVVENLIENACKYTRLKPVSIVEFGMHTHKDVDAFFIRDNGIGFDMAYHHQLFKPFYRLHAPELYEGEGIGLATVQRIIHRHGGRIWANSEKNQGSTFYFTIPDVQSLKNEKKNENNKSADRIQGEQLGV